MPRPVVTALLLFAAAGCAARATAPDATADQRRATSVAPLTVLRGELQLLFTSPALDHVNWGIKIESLRTGETLYSYNAFKFLLPASNQKFLTTAVAAERLGWDYRFTTRLLATGPIDPGGTLQGDLVVVGSGDPTINPRHPDRWTAFDKWADALKQRGIRAINGRIIGDDNAFVEPALGIGWTWENLPYGFGTAIGALQFNENQVLVTIAPTAVGSAPAVTTTPPLHGMTIEVPATTGVAGSAGTIDVARLPGSNVLQIVGSIPVDAKPSNISASVANATQFYVNALASSLAGRGITVSGPAVDIDDVREPIDMGHATELVVDRSSPLSEIVDICLKWSRNDYAETLLYALSPPGMPASSGRALDVVRQQLASWSISRAFAAPIDGSGLSRQDYLTAHALTQLLTFMWMEPRHADVFRSTMPVAGMSGTLRDRMKGTPLEGRVWAKTGTLSSVRSLAGYLVTRSGEPIVFAMLSNNFQVTADEIDSTMESALLRVFEFVRSQ